MMSQDLTDRTVCGVDAAGLFWLGSPPVGFTMKLHERMKALYGYATVFWTMLLKLHECWTQEGRRGLIQPSDFLFLF